MSRSLAVEHKNIDKKVFAKLADMTDGFSGRDLAKLMTAVQAHVYGKTGSSVVTPEDLYEVAELKQVEHHRRLNGFTATEAKASIKK